MESGEEKKGFTIRDRRGSAPTEETGTEEQKKAGGTSPGETGEKERASEGPIPELSEINFSSFILSLSTSALMHLGEVPDPQTQKPDKDLPLAKQTIDMLGMLKEKTRGNLTPDEEKLVDYLLTDLRWRYIRKTKE
jgi:hypothetical protein